MAYPCSQSSTGAADVSATHPLLRAQDQTRALPKNRTLSVERAGEEEERLGHPPDAFINLDSIVSLLLAPVIPNDYAVIEIAA